MSVDENDNHWRFKAACNGKWALFDSVEDEFGEEHYPNYDEAVAVCKGCPVFFNCVVDSEYETTGIWAGEIKQKRR